MGFRVRSSRISRDFAFYCAFIRKKGTLVSCVLKYVSKVCGLNFELVANLNEKNLVHRRVTATISKFSPQIFETYFNS